MSALVLTVLLAASAGAKVLDAPAAKDGLSLVFRASPVANLAYQLDCLAGIDACTQKAYRDFWNGQAWSPEDEAAVAAWSALLRKYDGFVAFDEQPGRSAWPLEPRGVSVLERVRIAAYRSETDEEYAAGLALLMTQEDARAALALMGRFRGRFDAWWKAQGRARAEKGAAGLRDVVARHDLASFYAKAARFYGYAYPPGTTVEFDIMAQPDNDAHHGSGVQIGDHAVVEIDPEADVERKATVVSHELFHYFYASAPLSVRLRLLSGFSDAAEPYAFAAYGLLNEAVATALGQGLVARRLETKEAYDRRAAQSDGFYAEPDVNDAARALVEPAARWLDRGVVIGEAEFVEDYLDAVSGALGSRLSAPIGWFRGFASVEGDGMRPARDRFQDLFHSNSVWGNSLDEGGARFIDEHAGLSVVFFLKPGELPALRKFPSLLSSKDLSALQAKAKSGKPFVYGAKRGDKAYVFLFVGDGAAALDPVIDRFASAPKLFVGFSADTAN